MWRLGVLLATGAAGACEADGTCDAAGMLTLRRQIRGREMTRAGINFTCGESCGMLGGVCVNPSPECLQRRGSEPGPVCHCEVEQPPKSSALQRTAQKPSLLREFPFIMTHDSATGFIRKFDPRWRVGQSQTINLVEQVTCGARALDIRLVIKDGKENQFFFHHGEGIFSWVSDLTGETLQGEWPKLAAWARAHPEELLLLVISHCSVRHGFGNWGRSKCSEGLWPKEFQSLGLPFEANCETLSSMTYKEALQRSRLQEGGHVMALDGACVMENWDSSITSAEGVKSYVEKTMDLMRSRGYKTLFQVQSFVQQKLLVPMDSHLNGEILTWITNSSLYDGVNLLEINLICSHGASMAHALGQISISSEDFQRCRTDCHLACQRHGACEQL